MDKPERTVSVDGQDYRVQFQGGGVLFVELPTEGVEVHRVTYYGRAWCYTLDARTQRDSYARDTLGGPRPHWSTVDPEGHRVRTTKDATWSRGHAGAREPSNAANRGLSVLTNRAAVEAERLFPELVTEGERARLYSDLERAEHDVREAKQRLADARRLAEEIREEIATLGRGPELTVSPAGARDVWHVYRDGAELGIVEPFASAGEALEAARTEFGQ